MERMVRLCPQCGVVAPQRSQRCLICELPLGANTLARPEAPAGRVWASIWCWFRCPTCAVDVPVDDFAADAVTCPSCGGSHGLRGLRRAFDHAHAVGDLAGPDPEGRFPDPRVSVAADNPFKAFGVLQSVSEDRHDELVTEDGVRRVAVSVRVAPGHPLCDECNTPLTVAAEGGTLSAHCTGCALRFRSRVPPVVLASLGSVAGVISAAHREDRPVAAVERDDDESAPRFRCPDCTTALGDPLARRTLTCEMCRLVSVVPPAHWRVRTGDAIPLQRAWVLFDGPSRLRDDLTRAVRRRAEHTVRTSSTPRPPPMDGRASTPTPTPPKPEAPPTRAPTPKPPAPPEDAPTPRPQAQRPKRPSEVRDIAREIQGELAAELAAIGEARRSRARRRLALAAAVVAGLLALSFAALLLVR